MEVAVKAERLRFGKDRVIFKGGHAAVQLGIGAVTRKIGGVLAHEGEADVGYRKEVRQAVEDGDGVVAAAGED